jgi:hypothetical protein
MRSTSGATDVGRRAELLVQGCKVSGLDPEEVKCRGAPAASRSLASDGQWRSGHARLLLLRRASGALLLLLLAGGAVGGRTGKRPGREGSDGETPRESLRNSVGSRWRLDAGDLGSTAGGDAVSVFGITGQRISMIARLGSNDQPKRAQQVYTGLNGSHGTRATCSLLSLQQG